MKSSTTIASHRWAVAGLVALASAAGSAHAQSVDLGPIVNPANGNIYYRIVGSTVSGLRAFAADLGGRLATINDTAENQWVWNTFVQGGTRDYYIGFSDEVTEGTFLWDSGQPVTFTAWATNEPNNAGTGEDFTVMRFNNPVWFDYRSGSAHGAIVEIDSSCENAVTLNVGTTTSTTLAETGPGSTPCLKGTINRAWFKVIGNETAVNVTTCAGSASNFDTVLEVFVGTCGELQCVGVNDDTTDGCGFEGLGSSINFFAAAGETYYIAVSAYDSSVGADYTFDLTLQPGAVPLPSPLRAPIYNPTTGHTYVIQEPALPFAAIAAAARYNGFLATVDNAQEHAFIQSHVEALPALIGYSDRSTEGAFRWMDGTPAGYTNWAPGEPNDLGNEDYTMLVDGPGWENVSTLEVANSLVELNGDSCAQAVPTLIPSSLVGGFRFATQGPDENPCGRGVQIAGRGVWYRLVGNAEEVTVSTCDPMTTFETTLRVFSGACGNMRCVLANNNDGACTVGTVFDTRNLSTLTFYAEQGVDYFILVGKDRDDAPSFNDQFGLNISSTPRTPLGVVARSTINPVTHARYLATDVATAPRHFDEALALGGNMVSIANATENEAVRAFLASSGVDRAFIGLTDREFESTFAWTDGSPYTFANWLPGEPNDWSGGEDYVTLSTDGTWNDEPETQARYGAVEVPVDCTVGGRMRGGQSFDGLDNAVAMPANIVPWNTSDYTVECWFRTTGSGIILGQTGSAWGTYVPMLYVGSDGVLYAADWVGDAESSVLTGPTVNNGEWTHVAFARSSDTRVLYVNGVDVQNSGGFMQTAYGNDTYSYFIGTGEWRGWPATGGSQFFSGEIDEFRVWRSARTQEEIIATRETRFFNPSLYETLVLAYDMDDAGGSLVFDTKAHQHARPYPYMTWPTWTYEDRNHNKTPDALEVFCPADIDGNGVVNSTDVSEFINLWFADQVNGTLNADFDRNGISNSTDVSDLINAFFEGADGCE